MPRIVFTGGSDFSSVKPIVLINPQGYAINLDGSSTGVRVVNTNNAQDFSSVKPIIITDINGQAN